MKTFAATTAALLWFLPTFSFAGELYLGTHNPSLFTKIVRPEYPYEARKRTFTGSGLYRLHINEAGRVASITIIKHSGHAILDTSAMQALVLWTMAPGPRRAYDVPITWTMSDPGHLGPVTHAN